jgi:xylulokinase
MTTGDRILVVDVGSTAVKAAVVDARARVLATGSAAQRTIAHGPADREHDPATTWRAVGRAIQRALAGRGDSHDVAAISVTGPRGSFAILDRHGQTRSNVITWQERRAAMTAAIIGARLGSGYRSVTGTSFDPSAVLPKLAWLRAEQPQLFEGDWQTATPQGLVLARLGSRRQVVDLSTAAHFGLLDLGSLAWSTDLVGEFGIPGAALPELVPPGAVVGRLDSGLARDFGLRPDIPLVAAGSDGVCSELGAGVVRIGQLYAYLGSAAAVAGPVAGRSVPGDTSLIVMPGSSPDAWRLLGLAAAGGSARDWLMTNLGIRSHARIERMITESPPGANGVLFVPTLAGASAPVPDGRARGVFAGLSLQSRPADLARAVHEGVALEIRAFIRAMADVLPAPGEIRLTGGGSRSDAWVQILADVAGIPVARVREPNPGLRGAAMYALGALGRDDGIRAVAQALAPDVDLFEPDLECGILYAEAAEIYATIRRSFHADAVDERLFRWTNPGDTADSG